MTAAPAAPAPPLRTVADVDREIATACRDRGRVAVQIEDHLTTIVALRSKHARFAPRINDLLDERTRLAAPPTHPPT